MIPMSSIRADGFREEFGGSQKALSRQLLVISLTGFLVGYHLMPNQWIQLAWMGITLTPVIARGLIALQWRDMVGNGFMRSMVLFLGYMTLRSVVEPPYEVSAQPLEVLNWLLGTAMLGAFAVLSWCTARIERGLWQSGFWMGLAGALAAVTSIAVFYFLLPEHVMGERLANWCVYGGLNAVCTGLCFGFSAAWLACLHAEMVRPSNRALVAVAHGVLVAGVFFTACRGALISLALAHVALCMSRGWRKSRVPVLVLVGVVACLQFLAPAISDASRWYHSTVRRQQSPAPAVVRNPVREFVERQDSGRFGIYRAGMASLGKPTEIIFGLGQWGTDERWERLLHWKVEHLHSVFLATFIHGGVVGLVLLGLVLWRGFRSAAWLAKQGRETWIVVLVFGCSGLVFDGQTLTSLLSVPRMEPLLVWFPMVVAASLEAALKSRMFHPGEVA